MTVTVTVTTTVTIETVKERISATTIADVGRLGIVEAHWKILWLAEPQKKFLYVRPTREENSED